MLVEKIVNSLEKLKEIRETVSIEDLEEDEKLQTYILWNLYVVVQGCIDLALKIISKLKLGSPKTYKNAFELLVDYNILPKDIGKTMIKVVDLRHILMHLYTKINFNKIRKIVRKNLEDIDYYLKTVEEKLSEKGFNIFEI